MNSPSVDKTPEQPPMRGVGSSDSSVIPTDGEILDWLQSHMVRPGATQSFTFSDSRDMGYRVNFVSGWTGWGTEEFRGKGNSVREVICSMMKTAGWRRLRPDSPNTKDEPRRQ